MVTGGIPYYLNYLEKGQSAVQAIEQLAFIEEAPLLKEFDNLFHSLFTHAEPYIELLRIIANHRYGISGEALLAKASLSSRGSRANERLAALEECGFLISFVPHFRKNRGTYYRVIDEYTLFYLKWLEPLKKTLQKQSMESGYWEYERNTPAWRSWSGYAFEAICYKHLSHIRKALHIQPNAIANANANANANAWQYIPKAQSEEEGAQIDLLFDRKDDAITLCEIKYNHKPLLVDKIMARQLQTKCHVFTKQTKTKKQLLLTLITAEGIKDNTYSDDLITDVTTLEDLFKE